MNRATVLMRPLDDLGFPGYSLSACGHVWSEHDEDWMTPGRPRTRAKFRWPDGEVVVSLVNRELPRNQPATTLRLVETRPDGRKERRDMGVAALMARAAFRPLGAVDAVGFAVRYHDGNKANCALWNLSYGPRPGAPNSRLGHDGRLVFKGLWRDGGLRSRLGFAWRAVAVPPADYS